MTGPHQATSAGPIILEIAALLVMALFPPLFLVGLGYRLWRWITSPDEATARKIVARREKLRVTVRRPADAVPLFEPSGESAVNDPALNHSEVSS